MNLYLFRHSLAVPLGEKSIATDEERFLSKDGRTLAARAGRGMRALELEFDAILHSPLVRARETAEIVADQLDARKRLRVCDALRPGMKASALVKHIEQQIRGDTVLAVGHQPDLGQCVSQLVFGLKDREFSLPECTLVKIDCRPDMARLRLLLTGETLATIGKFD